MITPILNFPILKTGDDLTNIIVSTIKANNIQIEENGILCVASKTVSVAENRFVKLDNVKVSDSARQLHEKVPRKSPQLLQLILDQTGNDEASIRISGDWIGAKTHIGRVLTSGGVDKVDEKTAILLPENPDRSAEIIGKAMLQAFEVNVGVIITDSDGREDIAGATQLCIGLYGIRPIRKKDDTEETICDMLAAAAGLVMGQRGTNIPAVIIHGYEYDFDKNVRLQDAY